MRRKSRPRNTDLASKASCGAEHQVLTGILNGVDYDDWNPQTDRHIAAQYSAQDLSGKAKCKQDLLAEFGITNVATKLPVIGIVSRFAGQKGFDLIAQIMDRLAREEMIMVVLGSGDEVYEDLFLRFRPTVSAQDCRQDCLR